MNNEMKKELLDIAEAFDYFMDIYKREYIALELTRFYFGNLQYGESRWISVP